MDPSAPEPLGLPSASRPIRDLPRWQIVARLKGRRVRQRDIAERVGVSTTYVNLVIARKMKLSAKTEMVWRAIERALVA